MQQRRHNITHLKELGAVLILPMPVKHMRGATLTMLPLVLHYINEIRLYSAFFKMQQVKSTFGIVVARTLMHDPSDHIQIGRQQMHWRQKGHDDQDRAADDGADRDELPDALTLFHFVPKPRGAHLMT